MPNSPEASVIAANVSFYREIAAKYDQYEACACDREMQAMLNRDLDRIAKLLGARDTPIKCLDCGGGSGNLSLKMLSRGWSATVVDVSPDMLAVLQEKASRGGFAPTLVNQDILDFLEGSGDNFDVITFSSVLHHLHEYLPVIAAAADRIGSRGVFYSVFDPMPPRHPRLARGFEAFDTLVAKLLHDRADLLPGTFRRIKKLFRTPDAGHGRAVLTSGDLAEYHALAGIDSAAIVRLLDSKEFVVEESRWSAGRSAPAKFINRYLRFMESFKILAQRKAV
jgi:ubiquinone/menaquinone biosynthesis C-methylase UbiE